MFGNSDYDYNVFGYMSNIPFGKIDGGTFISVHGDLCIIVEDTIINSSGTQLYKIHGNDIYNMNMTKVAEIR